MLSLPPIDDIVLEPFAENALLLRFGDRIDAAINARVQHAARRISLALPELECIVAYASLTLRFDPLRWIDGAGISPHHRLRSAVLEALEAPGNPSAQAREHVIPVCYGGTCGPDFAAVAQHCGLSLDQLIARHAAPSYSVAMLGFAHGFPYLLGMDPALAMPRRSDPRQHVPAGSVAIGGSQTGIYPSDLPGGWQLIGRTPARLFDVDADPPSLMAAGDRVTFQPIDEGAFAALQGQSST